MINPLGGQKRAPGGSGDGTGAAVNLPGSSGVDNRSPVTADRLNYGRVRQSVGKSACPSTLPSLFLFK